MGKASLSLVFLAFFSAIGAIANVPGATAGPAARDKEIQFSEMSSQDQRVKRRPRLRVTPRQPSAWTYPRPGIYSWPGPNAVRECRSWLASEVRASGTVIVPQMRCWWVAD